MALFISFKNCQTPGFQARPRPTNPSLSELTLYASSFFRTPCRISGQSPFPARFSTFPK